MGASELLASFLESEGQTAEEFLCDVIDVGGSLPVVIAHKTRQSIADKDRRRLERILAFVDMIPDARTAYVVRVAADMRGGKFDFG
jgi:hypothetical protein